MPKTKFDKPRKYDKLAALFRGTAITNDKTYADIGNMINCHQNTVVARFKHPEKFTLEEVTRIGRGLNIPIEELRQSIQY